MSGRATSKAIKTEKEIRYGRQTPTSSVSLPYTETRGPEAVELYNRSGRTARPWQELLVYDILAVNEDGLFTHTRFGYEVPRRNGKGEILVMIEMLGLMDGRQIMHSAHRVNTSHAAWERLDRVLSQAGIAHKTTKQLGLETLWIEETGGRVNFRTRSAKGGLGEGYDTLIIDEAQEYTIDQESALKYTVTDSRNPQTILCGTPPTAVSVGTVFPDLRDTALAGEGRNVGWAEWSVENETDPKDKDAWYETNPSLGYQLTERAIYDEITSDKLDFNIQRLGLWSKSNLKSAIAGWEWDNLKLKEKPEPVGKLFCGIKYGKNGENAALSIAVRCADGRILVEGIDCRSVRGGNAWIVDFIRQARPAKIVIDGASGQSLLAEDLRAAKLRTPILPTVKEVIAANAAFEAAVYAGTLCHTGQPSMRTVVTNCEKRTIGTSGGFGYQSILDGADIALMDSVIFAHWACERTREGKRQTVHM